MEVMFGNQTVELKGHVINLGNKAPDFTVLDTGLKPVKLSDFNDDIIVISVVPSLDTGLCDIQTKTFNKNLSDMKKVTVLTISNDLPFAQKRWCANEGMQNVITLSDHKDLDFAMKFGTLIEEARLQARAVFVLDKDRQVIYREIVSDVFTPPDYDEVTQVVKEML